MLLNQIDWGDDSAERDEHLLEYFVSSEAFHRLSKNRRSLVIGRKGSGKSALLRKLHNHFQQSKDTHVIKITPKFNSIRTILNDQDLKESFGEEIFFQHTWLRQILIDLLCVIGHSAKGTYCQGSHAYAREIAQELNRTSKDLVENISEILEKTKLKAGKLGEFGLALENQLKEISEVDALQHHVVELAKGGAHFVALIDDLDLGWDNSATANNLLLGLLSASNYISGLHECIHPIVFLREDVYTILLNKTQHSDKYRDVERIRWTQDQLISILEKRINFNRQREGYPEIDESFFSVFPRTIGTANTDNWLIEKTLSRPRELIQLARYYAEDVNDSAPSDKKLKSAEPTYSGWKLDDLCAEYSNQYPGLSSIMSYWKTNFRRRKYHLKRVEVDEILLDIMSNVALDCHWFNQLIDNTDTSEFLRILYEIGFLGDFVLGGQGGSRTYYAYQEYHEPSFEEIQIHPCFRRAVNTVERIRNR